LFDFSSSSPLSLPLNCFPCFSDFLDIPLQSPPSEAMLRSDSTSISSLPPRLSTLASTTLPQVSQLQFVDPVLIDWPIQLLQGSSPHEGIPRSPRFGAPFFLPIELDFLPLSPFLEAISCAVVPGTADFLSFFLILQLFCLGSIAKPPPPLSLDCALRRIWRKLPPPDRIVDNFFLRPALSHGNAPSHRLLQFRGFLPPFPHHDG